MNLLSHDGPGEAAALRALGGARKGLTRTVDYSDRSAAVLWGDGTSAAVLSTRCPAAPSILGNTLESSPAGHDKVTVAAHRPLPPGGAHGADVRHQEDRPLLPGAARRATRRRDAACTSSATRRTSMHAREGLRAVPDAADDRHHSNVQDFGNTAGAGSRRRPQPALGRLDGRGRRGGRGRRRRAHLVELPASASGPPREVRGVPRALELRPAGAARLRHGRAGRGRP